MSNTYRKKKEKKTFTNLKWAKYLNRWATTTINWQKKKRKMNFHPFLTHLIWPFFFFTDFKWTWFISFNSRGYNTFDYTIGWNSLCMYMCAQCDIQMSHIVCVQKKKTSSLLFFLHLIHILRIDFLLQTSLSIQIYLHKH